MTWKITFLALCLPVCCLAVRQYAPKSVEPVLEPWRWQEMTELSGYGIRCADDASDGSLWFGGMGGLVHYDGMQAEWIPFDDELKAAINFNLPREPWCTAVLSMPDGRLFAVVESSLVQLKEGQWSIVHDWNVASAYETRLVLADDGTVWLFTTKALWRFSKDMADRQEVARASGRERFTAFCLDGNGDAWLAMDRPDETAELLHIPLKDGRSLEQTLWGSYPINQTGFSREVSICASPDGKIWYADNTANTVRWLDPQSGGWTLVNHPEAQRGYYSMMTDRNGVVWAGAPGALFAIEGGAGRFFSPASLGLPSVPLSVFEASNGRWWIILRGGHVFSMDPGNGQWWTYVDLHFECESGDGTQWFKTSANRVVSHQPETGKWRIYGLRDGLIQAVRSVHASSHGLVWAVGKHDARAAFSVFDGARWTRHTYPEFGLMIGEGAFYETKDGKVWMGAMGDRLAAQPKMGGALCFEVEAGKPKLLKHYSPPTFPYAISRFAETTDGSLWLGAPIIRRYNPEGNGEAVEVHGLPNAFTYDMVTDANGGLWVAKGLLGIFHMTEGEWRQHADFGNLKGRTFVDLLPLSDGTLLAATDRGISRFDGEAWAGATFSEDFAMSSRGGDMRQSRDGALWFDFFDNASRSPRVTMNLGQEESFCTVRYRPDTHPPETFIDTHLDRVDSEGNIHITWTGRDAWENTPAEQLQYSWRMDGGVWSPYTRKTGNTFLALDSGSHVLEVRARDRDFNYDASPARSGFSVALPVWRRPWFMAMALLGIGGTVAFISISIHYHDKRLKDRARHLEEMNQFKSVFFANISHDLNTPLTSVLIPLRRMVKNETDERKTKMLTLMLCSVERMASLVGQLLDFRKLEQGKVEVEHAEGDIARVVRSAIEPHLLSAQIRQINCRVDGLTECRGWFDEEKIRKIVGNLLGNAIKYTPPMGEVHVGLEGKTDEAGRRLFVLSVADTGPGIDPNHLEAVFERFYRVPERRLVSGSGIGLNLVKEMVELMGGSVHAESPISAEPEPPGSRFTVSVPLER